MKVLRGFNVSLHQAALHWKRHNDQRAKAVTLRKAWEQAETAREELSDRYKKDFADWKRWLPDSLLDTPCSDIEPQDVSNALTAIPRVPRCGA